jgi:hypothetical protein
VSNVAEARKMLEQRQSGRCWSDKRTMLELQATMVEQLQATMLEP